MRTRRGPVAVDIVLLPPAAVARRAVAASRRLDGAIRLGPRALPHLTLAMAGVDPESVASLAAGLRGVARRTRAFDVTLARATGSPHTSAWYEARRTRELMALHRECVELLRPHRRGRVGFDAFVRRPGGRISASSVRWVARFEEDAAGARFRPHITLGYGAPAPEPALPLRFRARRLALCRLGNHCTCARVLAEARLATSKRHPRRTIMTRGARARWAVTAASTG